MLINGKNVNTLYISGEKFTKSLVGSKIDWGDDFWNITLDAYMVAQNNEPHNGNYDSLNELAEIIDTRRVTSPSQRTDYIVGAVTIDNILYVMSICTSNVEVRDSISGDVKPWLKYDDIKQYVIGGGS